MQQEEYQDRYIKYIRINKRNARIKYNENKTIFLIQDMMRLSNAWETPCPINKSDDCACTMECDFDKRVNEFQYYNCDSERGRGVKYFIKQDDL
ncbi:hypothetical protein [Phocaeicola dorei]|jgi:hypothetical protein|uniref:hypothetical protein n=1 Tax=Phocaeicola dorei TaxID=357276 RepID=UPI001BDDD6AD|nr:hypothetical protein [Phocaeicola dorei]MBT1285883.1 hypothetical protein [Phocaeicola dorei]MBT1289751.1 hypothetical protein [Phocaeicola dorei]